MSGDIVLPRLGWSMEQGVFMGWLKRDGELVRAGEPLFTIEGEKAVQEIEALDSGVLRIAADAPREGETVPVGRLLGRIEGVGASMSATSSSGRAEAQPLTERRAPSESTVNAASDTRRPSTRQAITPRARRTARRLGIDPGGVHGSGRNGRIREADILSHSPAPAREAEPPERRLRRAIAQRMAHSVRTTAPVTLTTRVDATNLVNFRKRLKESTNSAPSYTDLFMFLSARVLGEHPHLNARWQDEGIVAFKEVNIGIAVDTEAGLVAPVVRDVPSLTLPQLVEITRLLVERAKARRLTAEDMQGGTFTVTNLGAFGIDAFTPIINWPECAILGLGRIRLEPAVVNGQVVPRQQMTLSLTFDHRVVDGAPAARFLQALGRAVEMM